MTQSYLNVTAPASDASWGQATDFHQITWAFFGNEASTIAIAYRLGTVTTTIATGVAITLQTCVTLTSPKKPDVQPFHEQAAKLSALVSDPPPKIKEHS